MPSKALLLFMFWFSLIQANHLHSSFITVLKADLHRAAVGPEKEPLSWASAGGICTGAFWKKTAWQIGGVRACARCEWVVCVGGLFFQILHSLQPRQRPPPRPQQPASLDRQAQSTHTHAPAQTPPALPHDRGSYSGPPAAIEPNNNLNCESQSNAIII